MGYIKIDSLVGKTITEIDCKQGTDAVSFKTSDGKTYQMYHEQDCCEQVHLEDINGDPQDLVRSPIIMAEESSNKDWPSDKQTPKYYEDSYTWTFYRMRTEKGLVVLRWYGSSNGYYGESVSLLEI
jgi:hypothetical protein